MEQALPGPVEERLLAIAKLLGEDLETSFALPDLRAGLRTSPNDWGAGHGAAFGALLSDQSGGPYVLERRAAGSGGEPDGVQYALTARGRSAIRELVRGKVDELLQFLPRLEEPGRSYAQPHPDDGGSPPGVIVLHPPSYDEDVLEFFRCAAQPFWMDYGYSIETAGRLLRDAEGLRHATLARVRSVLTFCVRGERFCDGFWQGLLEEGKVQAVLHRLRELRDA
jgi:hypothetical protein